MENQTINQKTIKSCPFCGSEAKVTTLFYDKSRIAVQCKKCNIRTDFYMTEDNAIDVWNKREKG